MRRTLFLLATAAALGACEPALQSCVFTPAEVERLSYDGINFNLILVGNGSTQGALFEPGGDGLPYAPSLRIQKTFTNTGGPYIQQAYTSLEPGAYLLNVWGERDRSEREIMLRAGTSVMIQAECP